MPADGAAAGLRGGRSDDRPQAAEVAGECDSYTPSAAPPAMPSRTAPPLLA
ncbi:hypothetical protein [Oryza sativa Japonica Group]|uniref:Uncharacterized protein n=1 Tax=Oryza sativa subsp. japonica TaxID=39947 RepID=Q5ZEG7_ORYSJ|nr:hypothetical protein [Oryza sativa Japonica Group]